MEILLLPAEIVAGTLVFELFIIVLVTPSSKFRAEKKMLAIFTRIEGVGPCELGNSTLYI